MLEVMERRLLRGIMVPSIVISWVFGVWLMALPGAIDLQRGWIWAKVALALGLSYFQWLLARWRLDFVAGRNRHSGVFYRVVNELPTVALIVIVILVVLKPF